MNQKRKPGKTQYSILFLFSETEQTETVVISSEPSWKKENIIKRKTIVYEIQMDPTVVRVNGERLKKQLFTQYGFFKPKSEDIQFVSMEKFYEPYVVINGRYVIDYFRKSNYDYSYSLVNSFF